MSGGINGTGGKVAGWTRRVAWIAGVLACLVVLLFLTRTIWFRWMGEMLVQTQPPFQADMICVIGGDWFGNRILEGAKLAKEGYAPKVMVSGNGYLYGQYECDAAVDFAVKRGYDEKYFIKLRYPAHSTRDEAHAIVPELRRRHVKRYILVTSEFHTERAGRIFREVAPDLELHVVASPDTLHWDNWWEDREGRKTFLMEWTKSLTSRVGI
ncbi:MAG: hypothetical protein JWO80_2709 [Bryobacterales bacterium]|nr:hypothetical protein [Bryobacterales bacterium]